MSHTTLYDQDGILLTVRDAVWPPRTAEEVCASRLPELEWFVETLRATEPRGTLIRDILPGLAVCQKAGDRLTSPTTYSVTAPRNDGFGNFNVSVRGFPELEEAAADARKALAEYPDYIRSVARDLLKAGVDLRELADRALAESVMDE